MGNFCISVDWQNCFKYKIYNYVHKTHAKLPRIPKDNTIEDQ